MRYAKITHTYELPVPAGEFEVEQLDTIINASVSMVEATLKKTVVKSHNLRSEWEIIDSNISLEDDEDADITMTPGRVPRRYADDSGLTEAEIQRDSDLSKLIIESDADAGISFTGDVMGQRPGAMHPWDQGLAIFPEDHPLRWVEDHFRKKGDKEALERLTADSPKMKED